MNGMKDMMGGNGYDLYDLYEENGQRNLYEVTQADIIPARLCSVVLMPVFMELHCME